MDGAVLISRELNNINMEYTKMGCNQSAGSLEVTKHTKKTQENLKMDVNSNNTVHPAPVDKEQSKDYDESEVIDRFRGELMNHLQSIADVPPVMPKQLDETDGRMILIPSLFRCEETLAELRQTSLPDNSALVVTYLKSGTHWLWEVAKMLKKGKATSDNLPKEIAHLELLPPQTIKSIHGRDLQVFATHFPMWSLPESCYKNSKLVYVYRNPKDVCVSFYYHFKAITDANPSGFPPRTFDEIFEMFLGPSEANMMGNWFDNVADYWDNHRTNPQIVCVQFESMKKDPLNEIRRVNEHLGTNASDKLLEEITEATSFAKLKKDKEKSEEIMSMVFKGSMYRKGEVGDWKNYFSDEQSERMDKAVADWQSARAEPVPLIYEL